MLLRFGELNGQKSCKLVRTAIKQNWIVDCFQALYMYRHQTLFYLVVQRNMPHWALRVRFFPKKANTAIHFGESGFHVYDRWDD